MRAFPITPSEARRLKACELSLQRLTSDLSSTRFISSGSVVRRLMPLRQAGLPLPGRPTPSCTAPTGSGAESSVARRSPAA